MPPVVRHHVVIAGVVCGLVLTIALLAVCATCHQSRRERRRLRKQSTAVTEAPTQQRANVEDHRVHDVTAPAQNHHPHGWTTLANGGEYIRRDDDLSTVLPGWTGTMRVPDDRRHTANTELPVDALAAVSRGCRQPVAFTSNTGPPATTNTVISAVATIEKRPTSEAITPSPRSDAENSGQQQQRPPLTSSPVMEAQVMDSSPQSGRRIRPGWSASVRPAGRAVLDWSSTGTLARSHCLHTTDDRQWQRPASVRWTADRASNRRPDISRALLRSTPNLYHDARPRLGATHSIVF